MRTAYALLGLGFLVIILGVYFFGRNAPPANHMLSITSSAFSENGSIPEKYTCDSENVNPPLSISGVPPGAQSLTLIMDDPDIPQAVKDRMHIDVFDHWVVFNIPPDTNGITASSTPPGVQGANSIGKAEYTGPCPPDREHRYFFKLYALDVMLPLSSGASPATVEQAMQGHIMESAELVGLYNRPQNRAK